MALRYVGLQRAQVIAGTEDGKPFDDADAQLQLSKGTPRSVFMLLSLLLLQRF